MIKWIIKNTLIVFGCLATLWMGLFGLMQTEIVRSWALNKILDTLEKETEYQVAIGKIEFTFPFNLNFEELQVSQDHQRLATIKELKIACYSWALLNGKLVFPSIEAKGVFLDTPLKNLYNEGNPSLPLEISKLLINDLSFSDEFVKSYKLPGPVSNLLKKTKLKLEGSVNSEPLNSHLLFTAESIHKETPPLSLAIDSVKGQTSFSFHVSGYPLQNVIEGTPVSPHTTFDFALIAYAPLLSGEGLIEGHFKFQLQAPHPESAIENILGKQTALKAKYRFNGLHDIEVNDLKLDLQDYKITSEIKLNQNNLSLLFSSASDLQGSLNTHISLGPNQELLFSDIDLKTLKTDWVGNLQFDPSTLDVKGSIAADIENLNLLASYLQQPIKGSARAELVFLPNRETVLRLLSKEILYRDISLKEIDLSAYLHGRLNHIEGSISKLGFPYSQIEKITFASTIDLEQPAWPYTLSASKASSALNSQGYWSAHEGQWKIHIDTLEGTLAESDAQLLEPIDISGTKDQLQITPFELTIGKGVMKGQLSLRPDQMTLNIEGKEVPNELIHEFYEDLPLTGRFNFSARVNGDPGHPTGNINIAIREGVVKEEVFSKLPQMEADVYLSFDNNQTLFKGEIRGIGQNPISLDGRLPFQISAVPLNLGIDENPMDVTLKAGGEIGPFLQILFNEKINLTGEMETLLNISGTFKQPAIKGQLKLKNGSYESYSLGAVYKNIEADIEGEGSKLILKKLVAEEGREGALTATGYWSLDSTEDFPFEFEINPSRIAFLDSDFARISAGGKLSLVGSRKQGRLSGTLQVDQGKISIQEESPSQIKTIEVTYVNVPEGEKPPVHGKAIDSKWPLELDIKLIIPGRLEIAGDHFQSEWKGDLIISGIPQAPLLNGDLRVTEGSFNIQGKPFNISQGSIHFGGSLAKKTTLYIVASKEIDRITAEVVLKGSTQNPGISFRSNPPLSEREVLSYILFGRGTSDITPDQGTELNRSIITLSASKGQSPDMLTKIRNNIGLDRLDLGSSGAETNEFSLQLGKYIAKGVLVGINKGLNDAANRVTIEAELRKNLKAQAEVGDDGQSKLLLKWKKNY